MSDSILQFYLENRCSPEKHALRSALVGKLQAVLTSLLPGASLVVYGSVSSGLDTHRSDLDLGIVFPVPNITREMAQGFLLRFLPALHAAGFPSAHGIFTAAVPIIKLQDAATGFEVDISQLQPTALSNVLYVKQYIQKDPRVAPLLVAIKHFCKSRNIADAVQSTINSFGYTLMMIQYLQMCSPPVLPVLPYPTPEQVESMPRIFEETADAPSEASIDIDLAAASACDSGARVDSCARAMSPDSACDGLFTEQPLGAADVVAAPVSSLSTVSDSRGQPPEDISTPHMTSSEGCLRAVSQFDLEPADKAESSEFRIDKTPQVSRAVTVTTPVMPLSNLCLSTPFPSPLALVPSAEPSNGVSAAARHTSSKRKRGLLAGASLLPPPFPLLDHQEDDGQTSPVSDGPSPLTLPPTALSPKAPVTPAQDNDSKRLKHTAPGVLSPCTNSPSHAPLATPSTATSMFSPATSPIMNGASQEPPDDSVVSPLPSPSLLSSPAPAWRSENTQSLHDLFTGFFGVYASIQSLPSQPEGNGTGHPGLPTIFTADKYAICVRTGRFLLRSAHIFQHPSLKRTEHSVLCIIDPAFALPDENWAEIAGTSPTAVYAVPPINNIGRSVFTESWAHILSEFTRAYHMLNLMARQQQAAAAAPTTTSSSSSSAPSSSPASPEPGPSVSSVNLPPPAGVWATSRVQSPPAATQAQTAQQAPAPPRLDFAALCAFDPTFYGPVPIMAFAPPPAFAPAPAPFSRNSRPAGHLQATAVGHPYLPAHPSPVTWRAPPPESRRSPISPPTQQQQQQSQQPQQQPTFQHFQSWQPTQTRVGVPYLPQQPPPGRDPSAVAAMSVSSPSASSGAAQPLTPPLAAVSPAAAGGGGGGETSARQARGSSAFSSTSNSLSSTPSRRNSGVSMVDSECSTMESEAQHEANGKSLEEPHAETAAAVARPTAVQVKLSPSKAAPAITVFPYVPPTAPPRSPGPAGVWGGTSKGFRPVQVVAATSTSPAPQSTPGRRIVVRSDGSSPTSSNGTNAVTIATNKAASYANAVHRQR